MLPKICKNFISPSRNLLLNMFKDKFYYEYINIFKLKKIKVGPFNDKIGLNFQILNFKNQIKFNSNDKCEKVNFKYSFKEELDNQTQKMVNYVILVNLCY